MSDTIKIEIMFGDELIEFDMSKELFKSIETYSAERGQSIEESISQAIMYELDKEIGDADEEE